jgi:hypothetical protein
MFNLSLDSKDPEETAAYFQNNINKALKIETKS